MLSLKRLLDVSKIKSSPPLNIVLIASNSLPLLASISDDELPLIILSLTKNLPPLLTLIFALEPDQLDAIRGVKADATDEMLRALPKMPQGTCLLSGTYESVKHTIPVKIRRRKIADSEGGQTPDIFHEMEKSWLTLITKLKGE